MKKLLTSVLCISALYIGTAGAQEWKVVAFGQSTDLNFASLIKPEKVGINNAWIAGQKAYLIPNQTYELPADFYLESRGGKIANSHDGMVVFYTKLPVNQTFILESDVTLEQIGPEVDGKTPAAQEAVGLFARDTIGVARKEPQPAGYEEFPNASNVIMNALITQNKKNDNLVKVTALVRDGVIKAWGNEGISINKNDYVQNVNYVEVKNMHLTLTRTSDKFILEMKDNITGTAKKWQMNDYSGFMNQQDNESIYVGFFASRNAKVEFKNSALTLGNEHVNYDKLPVKPPVIVDIKPTLILSSPQEVYNKNYTLQFFPNTSGTVFVKELDKTLYAKVGELLQFTTELKQGSNTFSVEFKDKTKKNNQSFTINLGKSTLENLSNIIVSPTGKNTNKGTKQSPVDLQTAINSIEPNGVIYLMDGYYDGVTIPATLSGLPGKFKTILAMNKHKAVFINKTFDLDSSYWSIKQVIFDGNIDGKDNKPAYLRISGNHNIIDQVVTRNNSDTGLAISAKSKNRLFWPSYNLVINSDSYNNMDKSGKNADGFAAKLGVGKGNVFRGCIAHNNTDDGFDLYNKIEDGPNEPVLIDSSVTYSNGFPFSKPNIAKGSIGNGFKLGAEGQPVNHKIINSIALNNNMDGFSDNFNTGSYSINNNIAINSARYNYILRANPYVFLKPIVTFEHNYSIRDSWQSVIKDSLGPQVSVKDFKSVTRNQLWKDNVEFTITRDQNGNIVLPKALKELIDKHFVK
ncbi:right-handed parallel beta-helix repeat-containing protein [Gilliamella sp. Gris1-4]|uniref:right-handed parallel beta-helix repeat-containing protein n=1 Tax=Gilliamella sp. Gris1-4 TaxID=3120244 RepID=UPI00080EE2C9|nr:exopolygalacturonate lyase [Gilliamella apicola]OCG37415.1 exopolygalacturonate lyase [Gilliamella apicola]OCG68974.1 exopolygalacturonate lyase [Gilliamella apicola]